jgi:hypothetical protein
MVKRDVMENMYLQNNVRIRTISRTQQRMLVPKNKTKTHTIGKLTILRIKIEDLVHLFHQKELDDHLSDTK